MVEYVEIMSGTEGKCSIKVRNGTGKLDYETLKELLEYHPESFSSEDARELLLEVLDDVINDVALTVA